MRIGRGALAGLFVLTAISSHAQVSANCSMPQFQQTAACQQDATGTLDGAVPAMQGTSRSATVGDGMDGGTVSHEVYTDSGGFAPTPSLARLRSQPVTPPEPLTDFQRLAKETTGQVLPIFGRELFHVSPTTFTPANQIQVPDDYLIGPGDQILVRMSGHDNFNGKLTVDRSGAIYIPQVGSLQVAGDRFSSLQGKVDQLLSRTYKNYQLSVNLGQLRSIQVFVLGQATHPGSYTVSSLSTAFNAILESGGSNLQGSLRKIEIRRAGKTVSTLDLYDFLLRGDKSKDITLQAGDVIFIPVAGPRVALSGSVKIPAIYELAGDTSVRDVLALGGGLTSTASGSRISISRVDDHRELQALSVSLDAVGQTTPVLDGDI